MPKNETLQERFYNWIRTPGASHEDIYFSAYYDRDTIFEENGYDEKLFYRLAKHCIVHNSQCELNKKNHVQYPYIYFMVNSEYMSYLLDIEKYAVGIRYDEDVYENDMAEHIIDKNKEEKGLRVINLTYKVLENVTNYDRKRCGGNLKGNVYYCTNYWNPAEFEYCVWNDYIDEFEEEGYCLCSVIGGKDATIKEMMEDLCKIFEAKPVGAV